MVDVTTGIIINRNKNFVADYASNPYNTCNWYQNIKSVKWQTSPPLQIGSRIEFVAQFLGNQLNYVYEIKEYAPGEKLIMSTADGPFPMETTYKWETIGDNKTRMTLRNTGNPSGFSAIIAPFMKLAMRNANRKDLKNAERDSRKRN